VLVGAPVVTGRSIAVGELRRQPAADQGLEAFIDRSQRDARYLFPDVQEHLIGRGMGVGAAKVAEDGGALLRVALAARFEGLPKYLFRR